MLLSTVHMVSNGPLEYAWKAVYRIRTLTVFDVNVLLWSHILKERVKI